MTHLMARLVSDDDGHTHTGGTKGLLLVGGKKVMAVLMV